MTKSLIINTDERTNSISTNNLSQDENSNQSSTNSSSQNTSSRNRCQIYKTSGGKNFIRKNLVFSFNLTNLFFFVLKKKITYLLHHH